MTERATSLVGLARSIWRLLDPVQKRECVYTVLLSVVAGGFTVAGVAGIAPFLAALADPAVVQRNAALAWTARALGSPPFGDLLVWLGLGFVALLVISNTVNLLALRAIGAFSEGVGAAFHALLFDEYLRRGVPFHAAHNGDVLATQVIRDVSRTANGVIRSGLTLVSGVFAIGLIAAAVVVVDPIVALGAAFVLGASYATIYFFVRRRLIRDGVATVRLWSERAKVIAESFEAIKDVTVFRSRDELVARVAAQSSAIAKSDARAAIIANGPKYVLECVTAAGLVAAALWIYRGAGAGQWITEVVLLGLAAYRLLPPIQQVFAAVARIRSDAPAFERIAADLEQRRGRPDAALLTQTAPQWAGKPRREIRFRDVSYRHAPERDAGVHEVSLRIESGTLVGLAGPNGSGKTTLADLLLGVLVPQSGTIEIDGVALGEQSRQEWLATVAHVPQQIVLLDASVAQNVAFGVPLAAIDERRVDEALRAARLERVVDGLPQKAETLVGQNGAQLSGGERQRLGIARALYRRASVLVLDEATSALDTEAEMEIVALLRELRGRCTSVLVAHRASSLAACDEVFELDSGRLAASQRVGSAPAGSVSRLADRRP